MYMYSKETDRQIFTAPYSVYNVYNPNNNNDKE